MEQLEASFKKQLAEAKSDAERAAIQKQLDDARAHTRASSPSPRPSASREREKKEAPPAVAPDLIKKKREVSLDPLEGLKL